MGDAPAAPKPLDEHLGEPDDGVDVTLIRWMLSLTPPERLRALQDHVNAILRIREAASSDGPPRNP